MHAETGENRRVLLFPFLIIEIISEIATENLPEKRLKNCHSHIGGLFCRETTSIYPKITLIFCCAVVK